MFIFRAILLIAIVAKPGGGFNPFEKCHVKLDHFPKVSGVKIEKTHVKPPPTVDASEILHHLGCMKPFK